MISPTGKSIRYDTMGSGDWGAIRRMRKHMGTDFLCTPGQDVYAPVAMHVKRIAYPYKDHSYSGIAFYTEVCTGKIFYFEPDIECMDTSVVEGAVIGKAQDITLKYGSRMKPHIHFQIDSIDSMIFMKLQELLLP